jgi:hypothetical protein
MGKNDAWLRGLLAFGGAVVCGWAYIEAQKELEQKWRENNQWGVLGSAVAIGAAQTGFTLSLKELLRALGLLTNGPYLYERKRRNPLFLPDYEEYPV